MMSLEQAVAALTLAKHCGADWTIARNGIGPHAWGVTEGRRPNIALSADDAIRLAEEFSRCDLPAPSPS